MPLFRLNRATFEESMATTVIVDSELSLRAQIALHYLHWHQNFKGHLSKEEMARATLFSIKIKLPYNRSLNESFDSRCGWYTHYVLADIMQPGEFIIVGFLSEPLCKE